MAHNQAHTKRRKVIWIDEQQSNIVNLSRIALDKEASALLSKGLRYELRSNLTAKCTGRNTVQRWQLRGNRSLWLLLGGEHTPTYTIRIVDLNEYYIHHHYLRHNDLLFDPNYIPKVVNHGHKKRKGFVLSSCHQK